MKREYFFGKKNVFIFLKAFFTKNGKAQKMPVVTSPLLRNCHSIFDQFWVSQQNWFQKVWFRWKKLWEEKIDFKFVSRGVFLVSIPKLAKKPKSFRIYMKKQQLAFPSLFLILVAQKISPSFIREYPKKKHFGPLSILEQKITPF